jgi:hypothetical protein
MNQFMVPLSAFEFLFAYVGGSVDESAGINPVEWEKLGADHEVLQQDAIDAETQLRQGCKDAREAWDAGCTACDSMPENAPESWDPSVFPLAFRISNSYF